MAYSNIDIQKFWTDKSDASLEANQKKWFGCVLLSMLAEGLHADITFQAKGGTVKAHWSVLSTTSVVFRKMFQEEMKVLVPTSSVSLPQLPDITIESLQLFLVLLYITDEKTRAMSEFNAAVDKYFVALFDATHKFEVEGRLNVVLEAGLLRHLTPANCWEFYHKCEKLALVAEYDFSEACLSYVVKNCAKVIKSATTIEEMKDHPKVVQRCIDEAMSTGLKRRESRRQKTTPKRYKESAQLDDHSI